MGLTAIQQFKYSSAGLLADGTPYSTAFYDKTSSGADALSLPGSNINYLGHGWLKSSNGNIWFIYSATGTMNSTITGGTSFRQVMYTSGNKVTGWGTWAPFSITVGYNTRYTGTRYLYAVCQAGGQLIIPAVDARIKDTVQSTSIATRTLPNAYNPYYTLVAKLYPTGSGTLTNQGKTATFNKWSNSSARVTLGSTTRDEGAGTASITPTNVAASVSDDTILAEYTRVDNENLTWSPKNLNIVVHLINEVNVEYHKSTDSGVLTSPTSWQNFLSGQLSSFEVSSGAEKIIWKTGHTIGAYLKNLSTVTFTAVAATGKKIDAWKLKAAGGTFYDIGTTNAVVVDKGWPRTIADAVASPFETGDEIHLYISAATPNPKVLYDGFDNSEGSSVPDNLQVYESNALHDPGKFWTAASTGIAKTVQLSPKAWASQSLGIQRSVIVDAGEAGEIRQEVDNTAGVVVDITSGTTDYTITNVKFKQVLTTPSGTLSLKIKLDMQEATASKIGVVLTVKQLTTIIGTVSTTLDAGSYIGDDATGYYLVPVSIGYYVGDVSISITAEVTYGDTASPGNYAVSMAALVSNTTDVIGTDYSEFSAKEATRDITVAVTQIVNIGDLTDIAVYKTRTAGKGVEYATTTESSLDTSIGSIGVTMPAGSSATLPISVICEAVTGYTLKTLHVVLPTDDDVSFYAGPAPTSVKDIKLTIPRAYNNTDIKVILVVSAIIVRTPVTLPMTTDDDGKFSYSLLQNDGYINSESVFTRYGDFRVGDSVTLTVGPAVSTGSAIGSPTFNDSDTAVTRDGLGFSLTATLTWRSDLTNVFKIPVYSTFTPSTLPTGESARIISTTWDVTDTLTISDVIYYRLGSKFTVLSHLTWVDGTITYTVVSASIQRRAIASGTAVYNEVATVFPVVVSDTTRSFSGTIQGETLCKLRYVVGASNPYFAIATYNYNTLSYVTQGVRPTIEITGISPALLSDNLISAEWEWPDTGTPDDDFTDVSTYVRNVTTSGVLPQIKISVNSSVSAGLEIWSPVTSIWLPYLSRTATLLEAFTYFRAYTGVAPSNLVDVAFNNAVDIDGLAIAGGRVSLTYGASYDTSFNLPVITTPLTPKIIKLESRNILYARLTPPSGYLVVGWFVNGVLEKSGASLSVAVPNAGISLQPQLKRRTTLSETIMVLDNDTDKRDEGIWVSKLFRSQQPWKPLTAHIVSRPDNNDAITLSVIKSIDDAPEAINTNDPATLSVVIRDDKMRRLPPGVIQKTRFVRYAVEINNSKEIASVAIGSGATTMKGGH